VQWLEREKDGIRVHTTFGEIFTKKVALATNVFKPVVRSARKYIVPVYDYVLVTEPLTKAQHDSIGWSGREGIGDAGNQFHYYRQTSDGGILWGGWDAIYHPGGKVRQEYEFRPESFAVLASHFFKTFPQLEGIRFTHMWGGAIDTCSRFAPFWGLSRDKRVGYALGYTGLGVAATRFGAQVMLDLLDGHETERTQLSMVQKKPIPFPPEPFKYIAIQITRWSIHRADRKNGKRNLWLKILDRFGLGFDS
jgi:glycine/D-amino acid oxidase-like deaminating enzyme